jgi:hypothetical protein
MRVQHSGWFTRTLNLTPDSDSERCHLVCEISVVDGSHGSVKELLIMPPITITNSTDRALQIRLVSAEPDESYEVLAGMGMERIPERILQQSFRRVRTRLFPCVQHCCIDLPDRVSVSALSTFPCYGFLGCDKDVPRSLSNQTIPHSIGRRWHGRTCTPTRMQNPDCTHSLSKV